MEIFDLSLIVARSAGAKFFLALAIGIIPFMLINFGLLLLATEDMDKDDILRITIVFTTTLSLFEAPLATALGTLYLKEWMFAETVRFRDLFKQFFKLLPQLLYYQVLIRGLLISLSMFIIPAYLLFVRMGLINEIILLEQNRLYVWRKGTQSTMRRSTVIHQGAAGELGTMWIVSTIIGSTLAALITATLYVLVSTFFGSWVSNTTIGLYLFPIALWIILAFYTVVRLFVYLDLRIGGEGWDVQLAFTPEVEKLKAKEETFDD